MLQVLTYGSNVFCLVVVVEEVEEVEEVEVVEEVEAVEEVEVAEEAVVAEEAAAVEEAAVAAVAVNLLSEITVQICNRVYVASNK